jgi:hypothetical protein
MGTYYTHGASRRDIIEECSAGWTNGSVITKCLARACSGNDLWLVFEQTIIGIDGPRSERFIQLCILSKIAAGWGYKPIEESMGPYACSCPLKFLDMVPEPVGVYAGDFRKRVREYHARRNQKLSVGQIVKLTNGLNYKMVSTRKMLAYLVGHEGGTLYHVPKRMLTL